MTVKQKVLIILSLVFFALGMSLIWHTTNLGNLRIIACDVGQGDGLLIITPGGKQIVVDGGPGDKMTGCLSSHMPFWDRSVDLVLNTHPQEDHLEGLIGVLANYKVAMVATTGVVNETELFKEWQKAVGNEGAKVYTPKAGDSLLLDSNRGLTPKVDVLWPTEAKLAEWKANPPKDTNQTAVVFRLEYGSPVGGFCAYFTGDVPKEILEKLVDKKCQVLKIAHHGSKTGTNEKILEESIPNLAIIQVGKNNRFGHPAKEVLDMLASRNIKTVRTDIDGAIEVDSDGKVYWVKTVKQNYHTFIKSAKFKAYKKVIMVLVI